MSTMLITICDYCGARKSTKSSIISAYETPNWDEISWLHDVRSGKDICRPCQDRLYQEHLFKVKEAAIVAAAIKEDISSEAYLI